MKHATKEDYLRAIFFVYENQKDKSKGIKSVDIARFLEISKPSVSDMMKKLSKKGYLKANPYSNIFLTKKGIKGAKRITYTHRVIEVFLNKTIGHDSKDIEEEVHRLEHAFSSNSIKKLDKFLNYPKKCPDNKEILR